MKKNKKYGLYAASIILAILVALSFYLRLQYQPRTMSYIEFLNRVENGEVKQVSIGTNGKIDFMLKDGITVYVTDHPRTEDFKENLLLNNVEVTEQYTSIVSTLGYIFNLILFGVMGFIIFKGVKRQGDHMKSTQLIKPIDVSKLTKDFSHIAGNVEVKEQVKDVIMFMKEPEKYTQMGARMPKGLIFYGPPGTGKTLMAKAIAKEAGVAFFSVSGSDFMQMYVGVGASRIRDLFKAARKEQKAVIFIDEIDAIGKKRGQGGIGQNDEKDQTLNALLTEMSGFKEDEGIVIIAATNRLDVLDEALLRPGRFDRQIEVGYPDLVAREQIIKLHLQNKPISEHIDITALAKQTVYFTGAMLENLLNEAAILAVSEDRKVIELEDIDRAFYIIIAGKEKKDRSQISEKDRQVTAFHEAGHALVTKIVAPENSITKVTIIPSTKGAGGFSMNIPKEKMYMTKMDLLSQIKISLAGRAAEELIFGEDYITTGASNDIEKATAGLRDYMTKYGMNEDYGLVNIAQIMGSSAIENTVFVDKCVAQMKELYEETKEIIKANESILRAIAESLLQKETLNEREIASFF